MPEPAADPLIGATIAQYEVLAKLGGGGMGVVYKARDTKLGRHVALKFLPSQWSHDEDAKQRFIREAQAASATDHRNICTIHDISATADGHLFIVMALYEGPTLKQRLQAGPLPIDEALDIATQVADGLAKAHASGVVHRDIKPGNLILTEDAVKIVDFGLAKFADALQLTTVGSTLGTAAYMSPEQVRGEEATPQTDVWAIGVILYEMLAGHPPFRGGYAEAIAHAIRTETPASLRSRRPDIPEDVEQVVFRALHRDAAVRYASGRELARALRHARGLTLPQDLVTQPIQVARASVVDSARARPRKWRRLAVAAAVVALVVLASWVFVLRPVERVPILIAPVINQTGNIELEGYRLALTHSLVRRLSVWPTVRVVPFTKMLQALRRFIQEGTDVGSREALQALSAGASAQLAVLPTLLYEDQAWRGRVEIRDTTTATNVAMYETAAVVSSLSKETAHRLVSELAGLVEQHFGQRVWRRFFGATTDPPAIDTLVAERDFEDGVNWYEEQEYSAAHRSFTAAAERDSRNPIPLAWASRAARIMRRDDVARDASDRAVQLLTDRTNPIDRFFVEAVAAEARGDNMTAEARLRALIESLPDDVTWRVELASFHDRVSASREGWASAVKDYHDALRLDPSLIRPHLELCRLYNRLQEPANAKQHGQQALSGYQAVGWRGGEALARFCLVDMLRAGTPAEREEARTNAEAALKILQDLRFPYNLSRALYYVGMAAAGQSRFAEAATAWEQAATVAKDGGNLVLQPLLLMNLGVTNERLGNVPAAADYLRQSATLYEQLGDERRAAQLQVNGGMLRVAYGLGVDQALGDLLNALAVHVKLGDAEFEVICRTALGAYYRYAGQFDQAERELNLGLARAKERNLDQRISAVTLAMARVSFDKADYAAARSRLAAIVNEDGRGGTQARTLLGRVQTRLGDFDSARTTLAAVEGELKQRDDPQLRPSLDVALGELAYESDRRQEARKHFLRASSGANTADDVVIWARTYMALLDALDGETGAARTALLASIDQARQMERVSLETTARLFLARANILERRPQEAQRLLAQLPKGGEQGVGIELRALVHYWRGTALVAVDESTGSAEIASARALVEGMRGVVPEAEWDRFRARPDIRTILQ